jgi:hypothetical protein
MPLSCNVSVNLNNLQGAIGANVNTILNLNLGTPDGLAALASSIGGTFSEIGAGIANSIEDIIPNISLKEELAVLAGLASAPIAAAAKIGEIVGDFADATGLRGFVNLDLNDLSNSVFSLTGDFDPCNPSIPNIFRSPDGTISSKPSILPELGSEVLGINNNQTQAITDNVQSTLSNNQFLTNAIAPLNINPRDFIKTQESIIQQNVNPSKSGMGDIIRTFASGEQGVETRSSFISRTRETTTILTEA